MTKEGAALSTVPDSQEIWVRCDTLFTPFQRRRDWMLHILGGRIRAMLPEAECRSVHPGGVLHIPGALVAPGFFDLHVHGAAGHDFMEGSEDALRAAAAHLASHGTTSFLATTMTAPADRLEAAVRGLAAARHAAVEGAAMAGIHLEGPYLNPERRGVHDARFLTRTDTGRFLRLVELSEQSIRRITIAPEMDPGFELIREASARGIQVSLGHSDATAEQARAAVDAGATQATHTLNAMRPWHQREPGVAGIALTDDRVYAEVIADGIHVHPIAMQLLVRAKGGERTLLATDSSSAAGMPDGRYPLGDRIFEVKDGVCRDEEGRLAGSTLTLDCAVRNLIGWLDLPLHEALAAASAAPARSMRMGDRKGIISLGADADLVFLSPELSVLMTMVAGRVVYRQPAGGKAT